MSSKTWDNVLLLRRSKNTINSQYIQDSRYLLCYTIHSLLLPLDSEVILAELSEYVEHGEVQLKDFRALKPKILYGCSPVPKSISTRSTESKAVGSISTFSSILLVPVLNRILSGLMSMSRS